MKTILVAEDNDSNFILMTFILKKHYTVVRATNGKEAVDIASTTPVDLILMDIKMPEMDRLEATRIIKSRMPEIPIVALTANAFQSDRDMALAAGCDEFLSKPVNSQLCLDTIAKFIAQ